MRLIDADALKEKILAERDAIPKTVIERYSFGTETPNHSGNLIRGGIRKALRCMEQTPTIDPESLRPKGRCRYCTPNDCAGLQWDFEDIEVTATFQGGVLTICNQYGDEAEMPIKFCPNCGADMRPREADT